MKESDGDIEEGVFAGPAEAETGEGDADLGDREQLFGLGEEGKSRLRARYSFLFEMAQARLADGEERDFGGGKEPVHGEDEAEQEEADSVVGCGQAGG